MPTELERRLARKTSTEAAKEMETRAFWAAQATLMRDLMAYPAWEAYAGHLGAREANWIEKLLVGPQVGDDAYQKGVIFGIRMAASLPQMIINKTEQSQK